MQEEVVWQSGGGTWAAGRSSEQAVRDILKNESSGGAFGEVASCRKVCVVWAERVEAGRGVGERFCFWEGR